MESSNLKFVNELYESCNDISNTEKISILDEINVYVTEEMDKWGVDRRTLLKTIFKQGEVDLPEFIKDKIEILIEGHYKMILRISNSVKRHYKGNTIETADLVYYGVYGIYRGALNYDHKRNEGEINVASYFWRWIETYTKRGASSIINPIHLPYEKVKKGARLTVMPMCTPAGENDESDIESFLHNEHDDNLVGSDSALGEDLSFLIDKSLNFNEEYVISCMYGLDGMDIKTVKELSEEMGVTKQMIYNYQKSALSKLYKQIV